ncbi:hypothetical protein NLJ89_g9791 [Agrocybe chaxingu]|uniref:Uncharacterized protein n=1 Tax=Agrocybe chaxingu TaxID=84603 RepID=A0A9W8JSW9_9AGAR|nr:hypothetical protein NLJ89_g9791 [Agrocybe chaxingu]
MDDGTRNYIRSLEERIEAQGAAVRDREAETAETIQSLLEDNEILQQRNQQLEWEIDSLRDRLQDATALSDARGKELIGAQTFLSTADTISISEVVSKVAALNEEVFQISAFLGDCLICRHEPPTAEQDLQEIFETMQRRLGTEIAFALSQQPHTEEKEPNRLLAQMVLQINLVKFCYRKIRAWHSDIELHHLLGDIFRGIRSSQQQAVSGRWRALTRSEIELSSEKWENEVTASISKIFDVAGWDFPGPEQRTSFQRQLSTLFNAIKEIRLVLGQQFTSADLEVRIPRTNMVYDPSLMDEAYSEGRASKKEVKAGEVAGTIEMGLVRVQPLQGSEHLQEEILLKPKVLLGPTFRDALHPPSGTSYSREERHERIHRSFEEKN